MKNWRSLAMAIFLLSSCAEIVTTSGGRNESSRTESKLRTVPIDRREAARLKEIMVPLLRVTNNRKSTNQVRVGLISDPSINAANAGGGEYYITTGLLEKANDDQLRGVLAHEIAHDDLGHVARAQVLGAGLNIGMVLLEQIIPGSSAVTPIAGTLIARGYSRREEYAADTHGVELLERAGYSPQTMERTLEWILRQEKQGGGGGFLSSHPATADRIAALRK
jgi:predicted Zn-dependent protease